MKLLVDMNLAPRWVSLLTQADLEAVHWSDIGAVGASDVELMTYAATNGYIVLTHDLDFGTLLAVGQRSKPSVVQLRANDVRPQIIGTAVLTALAQMRVELEAGALVTVDVARTRVRVLPLVRS